MTDVDVSTNLVRCVGSIFVFDISRRVVLMSVTSACSCSTGEQPGSTEGFEKKSIVSVTRMALVAITYRE